MVHHWGIQGAQAGVKQKECCVIDPPPSQGAEPQTVNLTHAHQSRICTTHMPTGQSDGGVFSKISYKLSFLFYFIVIGFFLDKGFIIKIQKPIQDSSGLMIANTLERHGKAKYTS